MHFSCLGPLVPPTCLRSGLVCSYPEVGIQLGFCHRDWDYQLRLEGSGVVIRELSGLDHSVLIIPIPDGEH